MKANYEQVPQWWFQVILLLMVGLSLYACVGFDQQLQLPWWGLLLACGIALFFTLPIGVIQATTNQVCSCNHLHFLHLLTDYISQQTVLMLIAATRVKCDYRVGYWVSLPREAPS